MLTYAPWGIRHYGLSMCYLIIPTWMIDFSWVRSSSCLCALTMTWQYFMFPLILQAFHFKGSVQWKQKSVKTSTDNWMLAWDRGAWTLSCIFSRPLPNMIHIGISNQYYPRYSQVQGAISWGELAALMRLFPAFFKYFVRSAYKRNKNLSANRLMQRKEHDK